MDQERLRYSLLQAAEQLTDLANLIDSKGTVRLSQRHRDLIRAVISNLLKADYQMGKMLGSEPVD